MAPATAQADDVIACIFALCAAGALAGALQVQGSEAAEALVGASTGGTLVLALILVAAAGARWGDLLSVVATMACAALCHRYGALARYAPAGEQLLLLKANLVVGWLLYVASLGLDACARGDRFPNAKVA